MFEQVPSLLIKTSESLTFYQLVNLILMKPGPRCPNQVAHFYLFEK